MKRLLSILLAGLAAAAPAAAPAAAQYAGGDGDGYARGTSGPFFLFSSASIYGGGDGDGYSRAGSGAFALSPLRLTATVLLQGPYQGGGQMHTSLNASLPLAQPYGAAPWGYAGTEAVDAMPADVVDWVLVQLRTGVAGVTPVATVATRAALLRSDGAVLDVDGTTEVSFGSTPHAPYFVVVRHRNHLAAMSAAEVDFSTGAAAYDFTTGTTFGTDGQADLGSGCGGTCFGLWAGDGNASGNVNALDRNLAWRPVNGQFGYLMGDYNLSGGANALDRNLAWRPNNGVFSQVEDE